jgi:hypothetical protein
MTESTNGSSSSIWGLNFGAGVNQVNTDLKTQVQTQANQFVAAFGRLCEGETDPIELITIITWLHSLVTNGQRALRNPELRERVLGGETPALGSGASSPAALTGGSSNGGTSPELDELVQLLHVSDVSGLLQRLLELFGSFKGLDDSEVLARANVITEVANGKRKVIGGGRLAIEDELTQARKDAGDAETALGKAETDLAVVQPIVDVLKKVRNTNERVARLQAAYDAAEGKSATTPPPAAVPAEVQSKATAFDVLVGHMRKAKGSNYKWVVESTGLKDETTEAALKANPALKPT